MIFHTKTQSSLMLFFIFMANFVIHGQVDSNSKVPLHQLRLTSTFADNREDHFHTGIDIAHPGIPIITFHESEELVFYTHDRPGSIKYGNGLFVITHSKDLKILTNYSHIKESTINPEKTIYSAGEVLAEIGNTGRSSGPHLHIELFNYIEKRLYNPLKFINFDDKTPPVVSDVYFIADDSSKISLTKGGVQNLIRGGKLFVSCHDRIENSPYFLTPYKIDFYIDGIRRLSLSFDSLIAQNSEFVTEASLFSFNTVYSNNKNFEYYIGDFYSLPGVRGVKIDVFDFKGNKAEFKRPLRISSPKIE